jgi:hypothetical protein
LTKEVQFEDRLFTLQVGSASLYCWFELDCGNVVKCINFKEFLGEYFYVLTCLLFVDCKSIYQLGD